MVMVFWCLNQGRQLQLQLLNLWQLWQSASPAFIVQHLHAISRHHMEKVLEVATSHVIACVYHKRQALLATKVNPHRHALLGLQKQEMGLSLSISANLSWVGSCLQSKETILLLNSDSDHSDSNMSKWKETPRNPSTLFQVINGISKLIWSDQGSNIWRREYEAPPRPNRWLRWNSLPEAALAILSL